MKTNPVFLCLYNNINDALGNLDHCSSCYHCSDMQQKQNEQFNYEKLWLTNYWFSYHCFIDAFISYFDLAQRCICAVLPWCSEACFSEFLNGSTANRMRMICVLHTGHSSLVEETRTSNTLSNCVLYEWHRKDGLAESMIYFFPCVCMFRRNTWKFFKS
jgi:hypothetical protein